MDAPARSRLNRLPPCDDWTDGWRLEERFPTQELSPLPPGLGEGYVGHYLMNRPLWKELRREYEAKGKKLVPDSGRHGYAHRAHVICDLPPRADLAAGREEDHHSVIVVVHDQVAAESQRGDPGLDLAWPGLACQARENQLVRGNLVDCCHQASVAVPGQASHCPSVP